jgi:hypothetical protein
MKRRARIDKIWIGILIAGIAAAVPPLGLAVGFHSHPIGHHSHPAPAPRISLAKYADDYNVPVGGRSGYTIGAHNNTRMDGFVREFIDTLPEGFEYRIGSTSGGILADPIIQGRKLLWRGNFRVRPGFSFQFHFEVKVANRPGYYTNVADLRGVRPRPLFGVGTGPTAGILVGIQTQLVARALLIEGATPQLKFSARLTTLKGGKPLAGQWIEFTSYAGLPVSSSGYCGAPTNSNGVAECTSLPNIVSSVLALGYAARFDPYYGIYAPSYDHADLVG